MRTFFIIVTALVAASYANTMFKPDGSASNSNFLLLITGIQLALAYLAARMLHRRWHIAASLSALLGGVVFLLLSVAALVFIVSLNPIGFGVLLAAGFPLVARYVALFSALSAFASWALLRLSNGRR